MEKKIKEIIYLDQDFNIVKKNEAILIKISYVDGSIMFAVPVKEEK
jgi:hypothetical protein